MNSNSLNYPQDKEEEEAVSSLDDKEDKEDHFQDIPYISIRYLKSTYTSKVIGPKLIQQIWSLAMKTWRKRNHFYFGSNPKEAHEIKSEKVNKEITHNYQLHDEFSTFQQQLLYQLSLETLIQKPLRFKQEWLNLSNSCLQTLASPNQNSNTPQLHPYFQQFQPYQSSNDNSQ